MEAKPQNNDSNDSNTTSKTKAALQNLDLIMDLPKLSTKSYITNTDIILYKSFLG